MRTGFLQTVHDETLRTELGGAAMAALAGENLDFSTAELSGAVRRSVIARRVVAPPPRRGVRRSANLLDMTEVLLVEPPPPARMLETLDAA